MSNIILLSDNANEADALSVNSENANYPKENVLDYNINTQYRSSGTSTGEYWAMDFTNAKGVDRCIIYHDLPSGVTVDLERSTTPPSWTSEDQETVGASNTPIMVLSCNIAYYRYWRVAFGNLGGSPAKLMVCFIGNSNEISVNYDFGSIQGEEVYGGKVLSTAYGGTRRSINSLADSFKEWKLKYNYIDATNKGYFDTLFANCKGKQFPFMFTDRDGDTHYVRLMQDQLGAKELGGGYWNIRNLHFTEEI